MQHAFAERDAQTRTQRHATWRPGSLSTSSASRTRGAASETLADMVEDSRLLLETQLPEGRIRPGHGERCHHFFGSRMRKQLASPSSQSSGMSGSICWVMCFWYQMALPPGMGPVSVCRHCAPIGGLGSHDFFSARMLDAGLEEVVGIERLIHHRGVLAVLPGTHHGGGDVARARTTWRSASPWLIPSGLSHSRCFTSSM